MRERMPSTRLATRAAVLTALLLQAAAADAQAPDLTSWSVLLSTRYAVSPNVVYLEADGWQGRADVYRPTRAGGPVPTVIFFHGGGWIRGDKEGPVLHVMPYIAMGFAVMNVEYRVAPQALAPAAVQDGRCALRWVYRNAERYGFDTTRVVVTGHSAGGHLALTTGILDGDAGMDDLCPGEEVLRTAAVVNWYGITDVPDLLSGPNRRGWAEEWIGTGEERLALATRLSPLSHVRRDMPPILTIHGDADPTVPYEHAVRMHRALEAAGVPNRLLTIAGGRHGGLNEAQLLESYAVIREFLALHGITAPGGAPRW
ncbi:MAG TPA: alpha/beta hydrolase [Longimicrobiaceae bacterium]